jgi:hypothetical protein
LRLGTSQVIAFTPRFQERVVRALPRRARQLFVRFGARDGGIGFPQLGVAPSSFSFALGVLFRFLRFALPITLRLKADATS